METQKLYVTDAGYDNIGAILSALGEGYEIIDIPLSKSNMLEELGEGDVIFINCSGGCGNVAREWSSHLQEFVKNGGSIYVSDWAGSFLEASFPEFIGFDKTGETGRVSVLVTDDGLAETLGGEINLHFDMGNWWKINRVSDDVNVHIQANGMPLLVSFRVGGGHVIYTCFHNRAQVSEVETKLLQYLVFKPILSLEAEFALDQIREREFVPSKELYASIASKEMSTSRQFPIDIDNPRTILCIISWKGNAHLSAKLQNPDGETALELTSESSPLNLEYYADTIGKWVIHVNAPFTPYDNFPYVVHFATGDKKPE